MREGYFKRLNFAIFRITCVGFMTCLFFLMSTSAWSDGKTDAAKKVFNEYQNVVVTIKVLTNQRMIMQGREMYKNEDEIEATATVIDPSGLAVLSFSSIDPERIYSEVFKRLQSGEKDTPRINMKSDIKNIKMILSEGREVSAEIVIKDKDLDLVFVRPAKKLARPAAALDLSGDIKPGILDDIVILSRLNKDVGRIPSISIDRIEAIIKKPRLSYLTNQSAFKGKLGAPVFSLDGKVVGIFMLRITKSRSKSMGISSMLGGLGDFGMLPVILPAEEVLTIAKQALKAGQQEDK